MTLETNNIRGIYDGPWHCRYELSDESIKITAPMPLDAYSIQPTSQPSNSLTFEHAMVFENTGGGEYLSKDYSEKMEVVNENAQIRLRHYISGGDFWTLRDVYPLKACE